MVALGSINGWQAPDGPVTTWTASPATRTAAASAPRSDQPASYQQAQHIRVAHYAEALGRQLPRLMVVAWDVPGVCDIPAMTAVINAHVRRHDTYHNWFEFDEGDVVRHTIDPEVIDFVAEPIGTMTAAQIRTHAMTTTPGTLEWGSFTFGVIQHSQYFTVYASVDHLHIDGLSASLIFLDLHLTYQGRRHASPIALPAAGSYTDYTARQHQQLAALTLSSAQTQGWLDFARDNDGNWPSFPLPLGDTHATAKGDFLTVDLLDADETESFDTACRAVGARFSGGVLACAALAEHEFTGSSTYFGFTPYDTRMPGVDTMSVGWFASLIPVVVPTASGSFFEAAPAAQRSFDGAKHLAGVPFERVLELLTPDQPAIKLPTRAAMMVSFLDFRKIPIASLWEETNFGTYGDNLSHGGINMWINRHAARTTVTISFPDNTTARESVHRYLAALLGTFKAVVKNTADWVDEVAEHANSTAQLPVAGR
ncbi:MULTISPECIES: condensation domain-containing protein [unclassified Mycobacterium]|uniref:condensation domain-containing protein n=1 Tax=unclassified Mycobacterium TaxID=2642494 RepID=UPI00080209D0|nr:MULTISPECIES: condensation domain-containing protein [unclassified Mycobacterium]OBG78286.1 acyltransferase [Mycobacterium sp. E1214]OBH22899.1 acyltransferase [Mycobacterium sp. E1319]